MDYLSFILGFHTKCILKFWCLLSCLHRSLDFKITIFKQNLLSIFSWFLLLSPMWLIIVDFSRHYLFYICFLLCSNVCVVVSFTLSVCFVGITCKKSFCCIISLNDYFFPIVKQMTIDFSSIHVIFSKNFAKYFNTWCAQLSKNPKQMIEDQRKFQFGQYCH